VREPNREACEAFLAALAAVGLHASIRADAMSAVGWDATGSIEGVPVVVELKPVPAVADVLAIDRAESHGAYKVLVARRVSAAVREALTERDIGYFDARGRLRLWRRPLLIDTDVPAVNGLSAERRPLRLDVPSLLDVALAVLESSAAGGVRAMAKLVGRAPGTVSKQLAALRAAFLVGDDAEPMVPDLFDAVVDVWRPVRVPLAALPREGAGPVNERLQLGWDDPTGPGWVLADLLAAAAWGVPVVLAGDAPRDFYVPDARVLRQARTLLGDAEFGRHACTVAVAPAPFVCRRRYDRTETFNEPFFAPSPVIAALDLASDPGRGRETLDLWSRNLPPEVRRVW
jgi:hypothetical protein